MGKKGSPLVQFLTERLKKETYGNYLRYVGDEVDNVFRVLLLRKSKNICRECISILKDWNAVNGHDVEDFDYTRAKQRFEAALRQSVYLERVFDERYPFTYRILSSEEVKEKRKRKKSKNTKEVNCLSPLSVESGYSSCVLSDQPSDTEMGMSPCRGLMSDYESSEESPPSPNDDRSSQSSYLLAAIQHDPYFSIPTAESNVQDPEIALGVGMEETTPTDSDLLECCIEDSALDFHMNDSEWESLLADLCPDVSLPFDDSPRGNTDVILKKIVMKKIYKFKWEHLLGEVTLLTCEPKAEEIPVDADIDHPDLLVLDADLWEKIQRFQITRIMYEDNHLLLFLKPQESSFGKLPCEVFIPNTERLNEFIC